MTAEPRLLWANLLALVLPAALLAGALGSQHLGGLVPCEMCVWQRWPHLAAIVLALAGLTARARPRVEALLVLAAALAILVSGLVGVFHAGVEYHWWRGITRCTGFAGGVSGPDALRAILAAPIVRCDSPQWTLWGISLAGWNALFSIAGAATVAWLCRKTSR